MTYKLFFSWREKKVPIRSKDDLWKDHTNTFISLTWIQVLRCVLYHVKQSSESSLHRARQFFNHLLYFKCIYCIALHISIQLGLVNINKNGFSEDYQVMSLIAFPLAGKGQARTFIGPCQHNSLRHPAVRPKVICQQHVSDQQYGAALKPALNTTLWKVV